MNATLGRNDAERRAESSATRLPDNRNLGQRFNLASGSWAQASATFGAAVWVVLAILARMGIARLGQIELLFLFAPLAIVPLGIELGSAIRETGALVETARYLQPLGAVLATLSMTLAPGRKAGLIAAGWFVVCLLIAFDGAARLFSVCRNTAGLFRPPRTTLVSIVAAIARIDLAVGGAWFVASRLGMRPLKIQEPIGLLTSVHFHFAGFATATIAAMTLRFHELQFHDKTNRWLPRLVVAIAILPYAIAIGFVISRSLKMTAAVLFSACVAGLAVALRSCGKRAENPTARWLLQISAGSIFAGMIFSTAYAIADFAGSDALTIPEMARTHGLLNAFGFCLAGLLGWLIETAPGHLLRSNDGTPASLR